MRTSSVFLGLLLRALVGAGPADAAIFSDFLPGARPMGMGMAYTAVADDPYGMFYNPAGLAGSDFTQFGGSTGRLLSPVGPVFFEAMTYTRPFPKLPGSTVGAAFLGQRQNDGGDKDQFLMHFSHRANIPALHLARPLQFGGNLKFMEVDNGRSSSFGLGLDGGVLVDSGRGHRVGVSVTDLVTDVGVPTPSLNLGGAYRWRDWILFATDVRIRDGLTQLMPGMEFEVYQKLLKLRVGKGLPLDGVSQVSCGVGVNFSPLILDFAMGVPWQGFNRPGGGFQVSVNYKFGAPRFYGRFVGSAARQAEDLRSEILDLEGRRKVLQAQAASAEADKTALEGQKGALENRVRELQEQLRRLEYSRDRSAYDAAHSAPPPKPEPPKPAPTPKPAVLAPSPKPKVEASPFPRRRVVASGETLRSIAQEEYGDPSLWEGIYEANPDKVDRGLPVEGETLTIPAPRRR